MCLNRTGGERQHTSAHVFFFFRLLSLLLQSGSVHVSTTNMLYCHLVEKTNERGVRACVLGVCVCVGGGNFLIVNICSKLQVKLAR